MFTSSRRDFLRNALSVVVLSTASPLLVLGRVIPNIEEVSSGQVVASYILTLADFPKLATVGGSVKLVTPEQLKLNPDHQSGTDFPIAVTRVAESGADAFKAVSTYCTHGFGFQLRDYNPVTGNFVCPHMSSTFTADGTRVNKPNTPVVGNLRKFPAVYDAEAGTITLQNVLDVSGVEELDSRPEQVFLDQNYPNPFNPSTIIRYGLPSQSRVRLTVHSLLGAQLDVVLDQMQEPGIYSYDFSAQNLPSGVYFYRLQTEMGTLTRRMTVSK